MDVRLCPQTPGSSSQYFGGVAAGLSLGLLDVDF